jgi:hypothetical protein
MNIDQKALELTKKFTKGAPCAINLSSKGIKLTMFWPYYEKIAMEMNLSEVNEDVVKEYWFKIHNKLVFMEFQAMKKIQKNGLNPKEYKNCMVSVENYRGKRYCFHGGKPVCSITNAETETIKNKTPKF